MAWNKTAYKIAIGVRDFDGAQRTMYSGAPATMSDNDVSDLSQGIGNLVEPLCVGELTACSISQRELATGLDKDANTAMGGIHSDDKESDVRLIASLTYASTAMKKYNIAIPSLDTEAFGIADILVGGPAGIAINRDNTYIEALLNKFTGGIPGRLVDSIYAGIGVVSPVDTSDWLDSFVEGYKVHLGDTKGSRRRAG